MSEIIRVDHEALEGISAQFGRQSGDNQDLLQSLVAAFQPLKEGGWIGRGAEAFCSEMEGEILPALRRLIAALGEASQVTGEINEMFQGADEEASTPFKNEPAGGGGGNGLGQSGGGGQGGGAEVGTGGAGDGGQFAGAGGPGGGSGGSGQGGGAWGNGTFNPGAAGSGLFDSLLDQRGFTPGEGGGAGLGGELGGGGAGLGGELGGSPDFGIPQDWLSGVTDSLNGFMKGNFEDYGVPEDWLSEVEDAFGLDGEESPTAEAGQGSDSGGGGGSGGSEEKQSSGGGSSGGGGGEEPKPEETKPEESTLREQSQPTGSGGGGGGSSPASISEPSSRGMFGQSYSGSTVSSPAETESKPGGLQYQALTGGGGSDSGMSGYQVLASSSGGGGPAPAEAGGSGAFGLPIGIAAASPFLALLGKALKKKDNE